MVQFNTAGTSLLLWQDSEGNICVKKVSLDMEIEGLAALGFVDADYVISDEATKGDLMIHLSDVEKNELRNGVIKVNYLGVYQ